ncbi:MAG TPA: GDSL-type esterase/lipase family protein [Thermoanaerobaculia bacterium]|nr:GDSL-type esterase/lipase family protein [Thermoanaerobaculia bacterium]
MKRALLLLATIAAIAFSAWTRSHEVRTLASARAALDDGLLRIAVLGDSVARGAGDERGRGISGALEEQLQRAAVVNLGINGARTFNLRRVLSHEALQSADVIVLSIGGNDLYGDSIARVRSTLVPERQRERIAARVVRLVARVRRVNPAAHVVVLGLYNPYKVAWLDEQVNLWDARLIARFAAMRDVTVIRICDVLDRADRISTIDRFHPGATGYAAIAQRIVASLD